MNSHLQFLIFLIVTAQIPILVRTSDFLPIFDGNKDYYSYKCLERIPLYRDSFNNYYFTLRYPSNKGTAGGDLILSLYANRSFLANCEEFSDFLCLEPFCQKQQSKAENVSYLLSETDISGTSNILINYDTVGLGHLEYSFLYANHCGNGFKNDDNISGILALNHASQLLNNHNYSILIGEDNSHFCLSPKMDFNLEENSSIISISNTDSNWGFWSYSIYFDDFNSIRNDKLNLAHYTIFDLNTPYIAMPSSLYKYVMRSLKYKHTITCEHVNSKEICYANSLANLPTLRIFTSNSTISIPPKGYTASYNNKFQIMFASLGVDSQVDLKVNLKYNNTVVLGAPIFNSYLIHFGSNNGHNIGIQMFPINRVPRGWLWYLGVTFLSLIVGGVLCVIYSILKEDQIWVGTIWPRNRNNNILSASTDSESDYEMVSDNNLDEDIRYYNSRKLRKCFVFVCFFTCGIAFTILVFVLIQMLGSGAGSNF